VKLLDLTPGLGATALACAIAAAAIFGTPVIAAADNSIAIPPMNQGDPGWAGARLGASPIDTIGSAGCAITAVTMLLRYDGIETDPASLNAWLTPSGGYAYWDQLVWDAVTRFSGGQVAFSGWFGPDLGLMQRELDAGRPVVAEVRLSGNQHFVLLTGYTGAGGFVINDPWFADSVRFSDRYGDPASGIVSIRTFMPADAPPGLGPRHGWLASAVDAVRLAQ